MGDVIEVDPIELQSLLTSGAIRTLIDVRTTWERDLARLYNSRLLDDDSMAEFAALAKNTPIAFYCHHGIRSRAAAVFFVQQGFTKLYNLTGGIEAWSQLVDPDVPRY